MRHNTMNKHRFKTVRRFVEKLLNSVIGTEIHFDQSRYLVTGFIYHQADGKTVIIENVKTGDEDFIPYSDFLAMRNTHKSYQRIPRLS